VTVGLHEVKFDGYNVQVRKVGSRVVIYSRNGHDFTERFSSSRICCTSTQPKRPCSMARLSPAMLMGVQTSLDLYMRWPLTRKRPRLRFRAETQLKLSSQLVLRVQTSSDLK